MNGTRLIQTATVVFLLWVNLTDGRCAVIRSVSAKGNSAFTAREILETAAISTNFPYNEALLRAGILRVQEIYRRSGYLGAVIEPRPVFTEDSAFVDLMLDIHEGRQTLLGSITFHGNRHFPASILLQQFNMKVGQPLDETVLESDLDVLLSRYERAGFPYAQCAVRDLDIRPGDESDTLYLTLEIDEGRQVTIDEIRVEGNRETDPVVVVRETRIDAGELFNPLKVEAIKSRLKRLNIFADVSEPELYTREGRHGLLIRVQEGSTNTFDGIVGYVPGRIAGESGYITGLVSVSMRNLFGTGRKLSFRWAREDRRSQELGVRYLEPWLFQLPVNVGGGFLQRQQDSSYVRRVLDLRAELMLSDVLTIAALFTSESVIPSATDTLFSRVFQSSIMSLGAEISYDTRDDAYSPSSGARYRTDYQYGSKRFRNIPASLAAQFPVRASVQRFTFDLDFYLSTFERQVLSLGVHGRELQSSRPEEGEMFRFGGSRSLRGFRENQFLGSRLGWVTTEYRFLLARRSFFYGFVDAGYYLRPADAVRNIPRSDAFKYGYGIGIQLETGLGILGVSFALGSGEQSFSNGKVHFGLINDF